MVPADSNDLIPKRTTDLIKVYKRRWCILLIFILYSGANTFQWMEYATITNIVMKYYDVNSKAVDWTSIMYMIIYPLIVIPVSYIIDRWGLRIAACFGGLGTAIAAAVKIVSVRSDLFYLVLIAQAIGSIAQVFILCLPAKIAAVWFKPSEISTACSLGFFGLEMGFALGFVLTTTIVRNHDTTILIGSDLKRLNWYLTIYMIPVSIAIIFFFPRQPLFPPSLSQIEERKKRPPKYKQFLQSFFKVFTEKGFLLHTIAYGINVGVMSTYATFLNQIILHYFPNSEEDVGRMGFLTLIAGMVGSLIFGIYLDKTRKYKGVTVLIYYGSALSFLGYLVTLHVRLKYLVYITIALLGFFAISYMPVGFELAVEITFPHDESTTTGILNASSQFFGVIFTIVIGEIYQYFGPISSLVTMTGLFLLGTLLTQLIPDIKRRQEAFRINKEEERVAPNTKIFL